MSANARNVSHMRSRLNLGLTPVDIRREAQSYLAAPLGRQRASFSVEASPLTFDAALSNLSAVNERGEALVATEIISRSQLGSARYCDRIAPVAMCTRLADHPSDDRDESQPTTPHFGVTRRRPTDYPPRSPVQAAVSTTAA